MAKVLDDIEAQFSTDYDPGTSGNNGGGTTIGGVRFRNVEIGEEEDSSEPYTGVKGGFNDLQGSSIATPSQNAGPGWQTSTQAAKDAATNGIGAGGDFLNKSQDFISNNPFTRPDLEKNWVNGQTADETANMHSSPVTNRWARLAEAFNNRRWWDPGQEALAGPAGAGIQQTGQYGQSKRWEPIDTQELRAQERREAYEKDVTGRGIGRQDMYKQYPYKVYDKWQDKQMGLNYNIDERIAEDELDYGMIIRKADVCSRATGVYGRALWAMMGIGGYNLSPMDRFFWEQYASVLNRSRTVEEAERNAANIVRANARFTAQKYGITVEELADILKQTLSNSSMKIQDLIPGLVSTITGKGGYGTQATDW